MEVWFMCDSHTYTEIKERDAEGLSERAAELFTKDPRGTLFVRDDQDRGIARLTLKCRPWPDFGQTGAAIQRWASLVIETMRSPTFPDDS